MTDAPRKHYLKIISDVWCWDCTAKNCETCNPAPSGYISSMPEMSDQPDPSKDSGQQGSCEHPEDAQVEVCDDEGNEDGIYCMVCSEKIAELPEPYDPDRDPGHPDHSWPVGVDR